MARQLNRNLGDRDTRISKALSYLLRHNAEKEGLSMQTDGYVNLDEILGHASISRWSSTREDIVRVVANCKKQRFHLKKVLLSEEGKEEKEEEIFLIRANQGHSLKNVQVEMTELQVDGPDEKLLENCIHGTSYDAWKSIKDQVEQQIKISLLN